MTFDEMIKAAVECGLSKAAVIKTEQIELKMDYYEICKGNGCGGFGRCWMCPPHIGDVEENMKKVRSFSRALVYQTIGDLEDSYDVEGMSEVKKVHVAASQKLRAAIEDKIGPSLFLGVGGCGLCEECSQHIGEPCRFPDKAMPALEGFGIGVYNTIKDTPLKYINGQNTVTYFGITLFNGEDNE